MITYKIHRTLVELDNNVEWHKLLTVTSWGSGSPKLDLRNWREDGDRLSPGRGVTLSIEEALVLREALDMYLREQGALDDEDPAP